MTKEQRDLLNLDLQFFAEPTEPVEPSGGNTDKIDVEPTVEEPVNTPDEKTFTQSELERIIADRLARAEKKRDEAVRQERDVAEKARLEEQSEYKALYEKAQEEIESARADALTVKKDSLLSQAGYSAEQVELARRLIDGESDEEIAKSIELLKTTFPTQSQGVDPSPMNGKKDEVRSTDKEEAGRAAVSSFLHKLKL